MHAASGALVSETVVPAGQGRAFEAAAGDYIVVTNLEGGQVGDFVALNAHNHVAVLDTARTRSGLEPMRVELEPGQVGDYWHTSIYLDVGARVSSNMRHPLLVLLADTVGVHDLLMAPCDSRLYRDIYHVEGYHRNCLDNLTEALAPYGITAGRIPAPINLFQNTPVLPDGRLGMSQSRSRAGDQVTFRALKPVECALSSCPMDLTPINGWTITDLGLSVRPGPG